MDPNVYAAVKDYVVNKSSSIVLKIMVSLVCCWLAFYSSDLVAMSSRKACID